MKQGMLLLGCVLVEFWILLPSSQRKSEEGCIRASWPKLSLSGEGIGT